MDIEVLARPRSAGARRIVGLLRRHAVQFRWRNVDDDLDALRLLERAPGTATPPSYAVSLDGHVLAAPTEASIRDRLGLPIESSAAAFRAFATGAAATIVVPRASGEDVIVAAVDSPDATVCATVFDNELWIGAGDNRTLALHRLLTRLRDRDGSVGADRGYGPPPIPLADLLAAEQPLAVPLSA